MKNQKEVRGTKYMVSPHRPVLAPVYSSRRLHHQPHWLLVALIAALKLVLYLLNKYCCFLALAAL